MRDAPDPPRWHSLDADACLRELDASPAGLTGEEAARRLSLHGPNSIRSAEGDAWWKTLLHQFASPLIMVLLGAMVVTLAIAHFADAIVIGAVLTINASIGFFQERRAEHAMQALQALVAPSAVVRRDGERREVPSADLVPGDVILLESGDNVPADARVLEATHAQVEEALLTGESLPVAKHADTDNASRTTEARNLVFMGSSVVTGRIRAVVVATGASAQIGRIAAEVRTTARARTPLQERMGRFGKVISVAVVAICAVAFAIGVLRGVPAPEMFLTAVAIAVAAIPEGLPIVMTVALAVSVRRMAKQNAVIRRLPAVETLGSCTVIASDKTGTLTQNRMIVQSLWTTTGAFAFEGDALDPGTGRVSVAGGSGEADASEGTPLHEALRCALLANEADLRRRDGAWVAQGDPTEVALLVAAARAGISREPVLDRFPLIELVPFESERQFAATIHTDGAGGDRVVYLKGAPERVIAMCAHERGASAEDAPIDAERALEQASRMASRGLRVLALAAGRGERAAHDALAGEPSGMTLLGLVGMLDPPRPEAIEAIERCKESGVGVIMVTGDHATTASAIARSMGIVPQQDDQKAITGVALEKMPDDELREALRRVRVFARVSPSQKLRIVNALKDIGQIVAVTGDGVNDAPALKSAHIGAAMGKSGTDVAREASEMVLTDDNFATIYAAVAEGRTAFANIRMATHFLVVSGVGFILAILATILLGMPLPLLPAQILWLNVVTNGIQDVALAFEPGHRSQLRRKPRDPGEGIISPLLLERTIISGVLLGAMILVVFAWERAAGASVEYAQVATATAIVICKAVHVGSCRSEWLSIFAKSPFTNPVLFIGTAVSLLVHVGAMYAPPTQYLLGLEPLRGETWLRIILFAPLLVIVEEIHKALRRPREEARAARA